MFKAKREEPGQHSTLNTQCSKQTDQGNIQHSFLKFEGDETFIIQAFIIDQ
jgi:hypothetical protein